MSVLGLGCFCDYTFFILPAIGNKRLLSTILMGFTNRRSEEHYIYIGDLSFVCGANSPLEPAVHVIKLVYLGVPLVVP